MTDKEKNKFFSQYKYRIMEKCGKNGFLALIRDGFKCVRCGMTNKQNIKMFGERITIDHIDGKGCHSVNPNNKLDNLQTLCCRCHGRKDSPRLTHCQRGHKFTTNNTRIFKKIRLNGTMRIWRNCKICFRINQRKWEIKNRSLVRDRRRAIRERKLNMEKKVNSND